MYPAMVRSESTASNKGGLGVGNLPELDPECVRLDHMIAGDGSKNQVWAATMEELETGLSHSVAVKRFDSPKTHDDVDNIHREISILSMASTRCHHCARCYGWYRDQEGMVCVVMKRYQQSLACLLRSMPEAKLGLETVRRYGTQMAQAVAELHEQRVVLSDIKPGNVLLDEFDNCVLTDFGISSRLTNEGFAVCDGLHGTFNYMSPEAFDTETFGPVTTKSDAWSFACLIIEMVSGKVPWAGTAMSAICFKVVSSRETPQIPPNLPPQIAQLLQKCFAYNSQARPSFREIHSAFESWGVEGWGSDASPSNRRPSVPSQPQEDQANSHREERNKWVVEREEMAAKINSDSQLIAQLQDTVREHQSINEKLQEQLVLLVDGVKQQQQSNMLKRQGSAASEAGVQELHDAFMNSQEALNQCTKQKEVAKRMLKEESLRAAELSKEVGVLKARLNSLTPALLTLIADTTSARKEAHSLRSLSLASSQPISPTAELKEPRNRPPALGADGQRGRGHTLNLTAPSGLSSYNAVAPGNPTAAPTALNASSLSSALGSHGAKHQLLSQHLQGHGLSLNLPAPQQTYSSQGSGRSVPEDYESESPSSSRASRSDDSGVSPFEGLRGLGLSIKDGVHPERSAASVHSERSQTSLSQAPTPALSAQNSWEVREQVNT